MSSLQICTDLNTYFHNIDNSNLTGDVYWNIDDYIFPEKDWNDFVLVIATWWIRAVKQLSDGTKTANFQFMDGPFLIKCINDQEIITVRFIDKQKKNSCTKKWRISMKELENQIHRFASMVLLHCDQHQISGSEINNLRQELMRLLA